MLRPSCSVIASSPRAGPGGPARRACGAGALVIVAAALAGCASRGPAAGAPPAFDPDSVPEAYARSTAALMWPAATRAFQITPRGDLYNGAWTVRVRPAVAGTGGEEPAPAPRVIAFEDRWRPVAHWVRLNGPVTWSFEAFAWPATHDTNLFVSLEVRAINGGGDERQAVLSLSLAPPDSGVAFVAWDAPRDSSGTELATTRATPSSASTAAPVWGPHAGARPIAGLVPGGAGGAEVTLRWTLPPRGEHEERIVLSAYPRPAATLEAFARVAHDHRAREARAYWDAEVARGLRVSLGDPDVEHALAGARVTLLASRERHGAVWVPIGGPFHYRDVWMRDGARAVEALSVLGYTAESRALAAGLRSLQWPFGAFMTQRGQPDGTGEALWAFECAELRPARDDSIASFADAAARAWRWCETQRRWMSEADPARRALMPPADPRDNELVRGALVGTDAWALAGYRAAARLAAAAGSAALADSIEASRRAYAALFQRALAATRSPDVPAAWDQPARDWGNIAALYPCRAGDAAAADSVAWQRRSRALVDRLWSAGHAGLLSYGTPDSVHTYLGADLATWALLEDRPRAAGEVLDAMLATRSASGGWAELFSASSRDYGRNLPPHATSAAAFATVLRNMLVCDDEPRLLLTLGAREAWWRGSRVQNAPTRWGAIDLGFARRGDEAEWTWSVGSSRVDLQACKLEYSIVSPK